VKRRRIKKATVKFVSLVPRGANTLPVLYKSDGFVELCPLVKFDVEKGELLAVVYAPEVRDAQGDVASSEVVREMAHSFAKEGQALDVRHEGQALPREKAFVAENFIVQKGDVRFADWKDYSGQPIADLSGAWAVLVKIEDPALRTLYREGKWAGVSLFGPAELELEKTESSAEEVLDALAKRLKGEVREDDVTITLEQLEKMLADRDMKLLAKIEEKNKAPAPTAPTPLNLADRKAVAAHVAKLEAEALAKSIDPNDVEAMKAHLAKLNETVESDAQKAERLEKEATALQAQVAKLKKSSNVPVGNKPDEKAPGYEQGDLSKEQIEQMERGRAVAAAVNKTRGYVRA
jgi:hypothetical protein